MKQLICVLLIYLSSTLSAQVVDQDGYTYKTVMIGKQEWFAENLLTSKYNDGTPIPNSTDSNSWSNLNTGAYCFYDNNAANNARYGKLYNWYAVETDKLCPTGWHVPTDEEWKQLEAPLGSFPGNELKRETDWGKNLNSNTTGFSALPGGSRNENGAFDVILTFGFFATSTTFDENSFWVRVLNDFDGFCNRIPVFNQEGVSIRCVKD